MHSQGSPGGGEETAALRLGACSLHRKVGEWAVGVHCPALGQDRRRRRRAKCSAADEEEMLPLVLSLTCLPLSPVEERQRDEHVRRDELRAHEPGERARREGEGGLEGERVC